MKVQFLFLVFLAVALAVPTEKDIKHDDRHAPILARVEEEDGKPQQTTATSSTVSTVTSTTVSTATSSNFTSFTATSPTVSTATSTETSSTVPSTTSSSTGTSTENFYTTYSPEDEKRCYAMIGKFVNGKFEGLEVTYDIPKLLEKYGGVPGKMNITWTEKDDAPIEKEDFEKRPLPEADEIYWLYKYGVFGNNSNLYQQYIRIEHAVHRFSGTPKAFLEIRGTIYFYPEDFCGRARWANYVVDDRGITFEVSHQYCDFGSISIQCANPATCQTDHKTYYRCVAAPSIQLLSALIGGG